MADDPMFRSLLILPQGPRNSKSRQTLPNTPFFWAELSVCPIRASPPHVTSFTPNLRPKVGECRVGARPFPLHTNTPPTQIAGNKLHIARSQCKIFGTPRPRAYGCFYQYAHTSERTALCTTTRITQVRAPLATSRAFNSGNGLYT